LNISLYDLSVWVLPLLFAITFHEAAHGFVAYRLGDNTAKELGRVSFNPLKHIDPFGTVLLPAVLLLSHSPFLFGYAKPVPVNFRNLNNPRLDMVWVALAGPVTNILLALAAAFAFHALPFVPADYAKWVADNLKNTLIINVVLAIFNMLPIPPLDGETGRGRAVAAVSRLSAGEAGALRDADPDRRADPAAFARQSTRSKS
jgi:Zn-dependent protease